MNGSLRKVIGFLLLISVALVPALAATPSAVIGQSVTLLPDGHSLNIGGEGGAAASASLFDPTTQQIVRLASGPTTPRAWHAATLLPDGRVLILGGVGKDGSIINSAELFDPANQSFTVLGDVGLLARAHHTATVLMDGTVLLAGGVSATGAPLPQAELWDPTSRRALAFNAQMVFPRADHTATVMPTEPVLLSGGRDGKGKPVTTPETYSPQQQNFAAVDAAGSGVLASQPGQDGPVVMDSLPAAGMSSVAINARLAVRFSTPLSVASLNSRTVTLLGPTDAVPASVVPVEGGRMLFVTPRTDLRPGASYTLFISGAVDAAGRPLPFTSIGFSTRTLSANSTSASTSAGGSVTVAAGSVGAAVPNAASAPKSSAPSPSSVAAAAAGMADLTSWIPNGAQLAGDWRVKLAASPLQKLPPLNAGPGVTALSGQVLFMNGTAAANVTMKLGGQSTLTDATGRFLLSGVNAGAQTLVIDGRSANRPGKTFGYFEALVSVDAGKTTVLPYTSWMPMIDTAHSVKFDSPTASEVVITTPYIPGLEVHIPKGTVLRDRTGHIINELSITPVPVDRPPFPLPTRYVPVYFTLQPGGAHVEGVDAASALGARVIYPNYHHGAPGSTLDFWNYDPTVKGWYVYGQGKINGSGQQIVPDPGVAIYELTGAMVSLPSNAPPNGPPVGGCGDSPGAGNVPAPAGPGQNCSQQPQPGHPANPSSPSHSGGQSGCVSQGGDPVDCATGLFVLSRNDLAVAGTIPLVLTRVYRQGDSTSRAFGIGGNDRYDIFTVGDTWPWTYQDLILPDGGRIHFVRTSSGTSWTDAVYKHTATPSAYYGAVISWVNNGWQLKMRDGRTMFFAECAGCTSSRMAALREFDDRLGNKLILTRDSYGNLTQISNPDGRFISLTYDGANRVTQAQDSIGRTVTYQYDASGRLAQVTDPDGGVEHYTYDSANNMLTVTRPGGQVMVTNQYDTHNRVAQQTLADGGIYQFAYTLDGSGNVTQTSITDPNGNVRQIAFNSSGYATSASWAVGKPEAQTFTYGRSTGTNWLTSSTDALGRTTAYTYDAAGNLATATALSGTSQAVTATYTYESVFNRPITYTDGLGHTTTYRYDTSGNLTEIDDPLGNATHFTYNSLGQMIGSTDPLGHATTFSYQYGDLAGVTDPLGRTVTRYTDGIGRLLSVSDPLGNRTVFDYNGRSLPTRVTDARGGVTSLAYDANGNLTSFTDARGGITSFAYDSKERRASRTDPLQAVETYAYDSNDNLTKFTDRNGKIATFSYDGLNRGVSAAYGQTGSGGSLTAPDATVAVVFDAGDRATQITDSQGGTISRTYDGLDRLTAETTSQGSVAYTYDAASRRASFQVAGQNVVTYAYDNANRLTGITQGSAQVAFTYDAASRRSTLTLPNGIVATYSYDVANQLSGISYANGSTTVGNLTYAYDNAGRRTQIGGTLASMNLPAALTSATYDVDNRLTNWAGTTLTYDANGNLTGDGSLTYGWDSRGRLASLSGTATASFVYDAIGRRTVKTVNGTATNFLYDGPNAVQELAGATPTANLLSGLRIDEIYSRIDGLGARSFITDALGSTVALTDTSGVLKTSYAYEPYGKSSATGETSSNSAQYTGRENDGTGLFYYRARYYQPVLGRFLSEDPIDLNGGANLYAYVGGNPSSYIDPYGKFIFNLGAAGVGAAIGGIAGGLTAYLQGGSFSDIAVSTIAGGLVGGLSGLTLGASEALATGAISSAAGNAAGQWLTGNHGIDPGQVCLAAGAGAAGALTGIGAAAVGSSPIGAAAAGGLAAAETQALFDIGTWFNTRFPSKR
ncbi:Ig-like domain-containing protein [Burkholderia cenocepacia]|uniref:RHS repeat-associated core domain-containing protein n=1 Tax=Burkholderia cenocepacia TaxID=95486 RepID=UPI001B8EBC6A|nr:RHS repeat-associated core domain-containing protein [Burkholderia cenocepacia]MBR8091543.1 Ig-like domain-containing protein [Burkholderia cenocepacia]